MAGGGHSSSIMRSSLRSISSRRRRRRERLLASIMEVRKGPSLHFWPGPQSASSASCLGEWQEALSLPHPRAEHPLVAQDPVWDLFVCAKDLLVEAIMVLEKPSSPLIEHDGLIHFEERPLDHRLRQSVPLQCLIIERL